MLLDNNKELIKTVDSLIYVIQQQRDAEEGQVERSDLEIAVLSQVANETCDYVSGCVSHHC